jgi:hypothetical protein
MLKAIISAAGAAIKAAWRALKFTASFPFKALSALGGGGSAMPEVEEPEPQTIDPEDNSALAGLIMSWAVGCIRTRTLEPAPASLPAAHRAWLESLDMKEAVLMVDAGRMGIQAHVSGGQLRGVPPHDMTPSAIPSWRKAHAAVRQAEMDCSPRWQKISRRPSIDAAGPDYRSPLRSPAAAEPGNDDSSPGYVPRFA